MNGFVLAHASDLHLPFEPRLRPSQRLSKRQLSAWSWQRRKALHRPEILDALAADIRAQAVDHVVITGDVTNFSLPGEFGAAAEWLRALAPPGALSVVPGNHDALVRLPEAEGLGHWRDWMPGEAGWPWRRRFDGVTLIGLDSALPTLPLLARGALGSEQLERLEAVLAEEGAAGHVRAVALHHPPAEGAVSRRKALADRAALRAVLRRAGAELVLHGHARDARLDALAGPAEPIPCLCVPSSSAVPSAVDEGARWHRLVLRGGARPSAEVRVRRWSMLDGAFVDAGTYELLLPRNA
ncbi:metallophosphoesterase family protein [Piscinibacter koreensis]|uniref:Metallophosphoesterase n=1 Tax=Piscinibacter koreensis TaxID=2742824 RepID=A0A7Y6NLD8_9BURK|nr:metallophosphoesterase [Schlegelella koreensis]NUZ05231.1 metallophosphoesterase [Schlegelella koreensis]